MLVNLEYYFDTYGGNVLENDDEALKALKNAEKQINVICGNRLNNGFLEDKAQHLIPLIQDIICEQAEFNTENKELIESALSQYSINGVSMKIEPSKSICQVSGIYTKNIIYQELAMYGLTYRGLN